MGDMKLKFAPLSRLGRDERGSILVQFTVYIIAVSGMIGLALDGGRWMLLHSGLQDLADAAALAGASDLNGTLGAISRARSDAQAMANRNPPRWYDIAGSQIIDVQFYSALDLRNGDTPATGDRDAKYIKVTTASDWQVVPTFLAAVGAAPKRASATAWAQYTSAQCFPTAMMLCNPAEPPTGSTGNSSSFNPTPGQAFIFSTRGNTGGYSPGVSNLLDTPDGSGSDADIQRFLSQQTPSLCFTGGTSPAQGQKTNATVNGINVRFDQQPPPGVSGMDLTPAPIKIDGLSPIGGSSPPNSCNRPGNISALSLPLPQDPLPYQSVGGSGGSQIGGGVALADLQTYWSNHHPGALPAGITTRWQVYSLEVAGTGDAGTWLTDTVEPPGPQCAPASTQVPPEFAADRRILHVAVVDCLYWGVQGNAVNNIPINTYADFFITHPTPQSGINAGSIYTEFVAKHQIGNSGPLRRLVRLVR
jgi:hypothetical protein